MMERLSHHVESQSESALGISEQIKLSHVQASDAHESLLDTMNAAMHHDSITSLLEIIIGSGLPMLK